MEYFRRTSSYVLSGLVPTAKKSLCLLPLPIKFSFCNQTNTAQISTRKQSKRIRSRKLKTKKEHRAKQFIHNHVTKLGAEDKATEKRVDETMKKLYKKPSFPPLQTPSSSERIHPPEHPRKEESIKKMIGVESKKSKNRKQSQIIGKEVKIKHKHLSPPSTVTTSPPTVEIPKSTVLPPLRTISEVIQEEAATILVKRTTKTPEEIQEGINETNESILEQKKRKTTTTTTPPSLIDSATSAEEDKYSTLSNNKDSKTNGEEAKENGHNMLDLEKVQN
jgi:hypothetical protein